ncbi:uncharacterized protein SPAPADRAFT_49625 [Spathaspora passalidarum NRRL Y-27907]|uniref:Serine/threonine-protein phosphatase 2A activator n=1 Tax=Spathaspora passalidarum (strain NRRL Y-27907 / 11-Y1) TaxID=619300 RepID=G3AJD7_SPAPN|nr:uncharacterized protein SPAPADRAFT_49625 [Spathaspora passalidarum NRRL Y-27907]EGW34596.1 hypothetical protein SPAPADRAFT_49625 [Spathaspora passalidarum NRRL Y-27907]
MTNWSTPTKKIYDASDLKNFKNSIAFVKLQRSLDFIMETVQGCKVPKDMLNMDIVTRSGKQSTKVSSIVTAIPENTQSMPPPSPTPILTNEFSSNTSGLINIFNELNRLIDETPPLKGPTRFGNLACRTWHDKVNVCLTSLIKENLQFPTRLDVDGFLLEAVYYIQNSFGSKIRLDYGTGHELSFIAFLGALLDYKILDCPKGEELLAVFAKYYDLVRRLILDYNLEPAGSHGVWGLDDHFHFMYIIGACQFNTDKLAPVVSRVLTSQVINSYKQSNLYINAIAFIFKLKMGPFNEHSPIIYDIHTTVYSWAKVKQGLIRMYMVEVLGKFPVIQHFWFGDILYPWTDIKTGKELPVYQKDNQNEEKSVQSHNTNIKINPPSSRAGIPMTAAPWANTARPSVPHNRHTTPTTTTSNYSSK